MVIDSLPDRHGANPTEDDFVRRRRWACLAIALSVAATLAVVAFPLVRRLPLMEGEFLVAWRSAAARRLLPLLLVGLLALAAGGWRLVRNLGRGVSPARWRAVHGLSPLLLAPLCAAGSQCGPWVGATLAGVAVPFGIPVLLAGSLERWVGPLGEEAEAPPRTLRMTWWLLGYFAFLLCLGLYFNGRAGEDTGDEAHYLTQLTSLLTDGDLAVGNNLPEELPPPGPGRTTMLRSSHLVEPEAGRCYSYHAFGLPLLGWPFGRAGFVGRQLVLALIGAMALAGCWAICRAAGAPCRATFAVVASLGLSFPWAVYAIRFLPEVLGCGLLAWAFWGMMVQSRRPWRSMVVAAVCCGSLPYAHTRFAVPSLVVAFCYGVEGLLLRERIRAKLARLGLFCASYAAFGVGLLQCHARIYGAGGAYSYGDILLSYPLAMWGIVADHRGLLSVLPVLAWHLVAGVLACASVKSYRRDGVVAVAIVAAVLVTSCSNTSALGGACVPGRYLLTALPVLLPASALVLARTGRAGRLWFYFLSTLSVLLLAATTLLIHTRMGTFVLPIRRLSQFFGFNALFRPLAAMRDARSLATVLYGSAFVLAVLLVTLVLADRRRRRRLVNGLAAFGALVGLYGGFRVHAAEQTARVTSQVLLGAPTRRAEFRRLPARSQTKDLFDAMGTLEFLGARAPQMLTNRDLGSTLVDGVRCLPRQAVNDWLGRPYRWHAMHAPIRSNQDGGSAIRVAGVVHGGVRATFAMRQGAYTLEDGEWSVSEGPFQHTWLIPTRRGRGNVMPLVRLEGPEGTVRINRVLVAPYSSTLMESGRFSAGDPQDVSVLAAEGRYEP